MTFIGHMEEEVDGCIVDGLCAEYSAEIFPLVDDRWVVADVGCDCFFHKYFEHLCEFFLGHRI